jgi:type I restriction enzyme M protein
MARSKKSITTKKDAPGSAQPDINFEKELWDTAVRLRGNIAPADYKHYILPLLFLRYLSLKYDRRREELEHLVKEPSSEYCTRDPKIAQEILNDPDEYKREGVFIIPEEARWDHLVRHAQDDDIKLKLDRAMELLERTYPELRGILPRIYGGSNLSRENVTGLINIFSRDIFKADYGKESDILGRVYEYFITNFASTEGIRGGEFFTPRSVVKLLVAMMEPKEGKVFDPACGSGGMFVQSAAFTTNGGGLSFYGQESVDTTLRLCKMNLILHGLYGEIRLGNSLLDDKHPDLKADIVIANPPFNMDAWGADRVDGNDKRLWIGKRKCSPTNSNANYFWIMHFLYHVKDGGTTGFVMANGSMTTNLTEEKATRMALVEEGFVDCIVQLPDKLFFGTGIPACLWFLSRNRDGRGPYRKRLGEILFIDARKKGGMVNRRQRVLTDDEIAEIAAVYHHYREVEGDRQNIPGFCKTVTVDEIRSHDYKLTPGIYVGTEQNEVDETPFEVKMAELTTQLKTQFAESNILQEKILRNFERLK